MFWDAGIRFCSLIGFNRGVASFKSRGGETSSGESHICVWLRFAFISTPLQKIPARKSQGSALKGGDSYFYPAFCWLLQLVLEVSCRRPSLFSALFYLF